MHRPLQGDPKQVTLVKKPSGWYAHIACDIGETLKVEPTAAIAVDVGTTHYLTTSDGEKVDNPRWSRQAEGLLAKALKNTILAGRKAVNAGRISCTCHRVAPRAHREQAQRLYRKTRLQPLPPQAKERPGRRGFGHLEYG